MILDVDHRAMSEVVFNHNASCFEASNALNSDAGFFTKHWVRLREPSRTNYCMSLETYQFNNDISNLHIIWRGDEPLDSLHFAVKVFSLLIFLYSWANWLFYVGQGPICVVFY